MAPPLDLPDEDEEAAASCACAACNCDECAVARSSLSQHCNTTPRVSNAAFCSAGTDKHCCKRSSAPPPLLPLLLDDAADEAGDADDTTSAMHIFPSSSKSASMRMAVSCSLSRASRAAAVVPLKLRLFVAALKVLRSNFDLSFDFKLLFRRQLQRG